MILLRLGPVEQAQTKARRSKRAQALFTKLLDAGNVAIIFAGDEEGDRACWAMLCSHLGFWFRAGLRQLQHRNVKISRKGSNYLISRMLLTYPTQQGILLWRPYHSYDSKLCDKSHFQANPQVASIGSNLGDMAETPTKVIYLRKFLLMKLRCSQQSLPSHLESQTLCHRKHPGFASNYRGRSHYLPRDHLQERPRLFPFKTNRP